MSTIPSIETFTNGQVLTHTSLNTLVSSIRDTVNTYGLLTDVSRSITAVQTFSATPIMSAGLTVSASGITVTGNSTITGTLGGLTGLTVASGAITITAAASKIVPGVTSLSLRNTADNADNLILTDAGAATFRSTVGGITTLTATSLAGTITTAAQPNITSFGALTALSIGGNLTFTGASRKIIGGSTSFLMRNTADTETWLSYTESGEDIAIGPTGGMVAIGLASISNVATTGFAQLGFLTGGPSGAAPNGSIALTADNFLWARIAGAWKSVALT